MGNSYSESLIGKKVEIIYGGCGCTIADGYSGEIVSRETVEELLADEKVWYFGEDYTKKSKIYVLHITDEKEIYIFGLCDNHCVKVKNSFLDSFNFLGSSFVFVLILFLNKIQKIDETLFYILLSIPLYILLFTRKRFYYIKHIKQ